MNDDFTAKARIAEAIQALNAVAVLREKDFRVGAKQQVLHAMRLLLEALGEL